MPKITRGFTPRRYRRNQPGWLNRLSPKDRAVVDAFAQWLNPIDWQLFATLTFPRSLHPEAAERILREFINRLESHHRSNFCVVGAREMRSRHSGEPVPPHFHVLLASNGAISKEAIESIWLGLIGRRGAACLKQDNVLVERFDRTAPAAQYCLKSMNDDHGDWLFHRLDSFLPNLPQSARPNHRKGRRLKRNQQQKVRKAYEAR